MVLNAGKVVLAASLLLFSVAVYAQDGDEVELGWSGVGEFGFVSTTGNSETTALNGKLEFIYNTQTWRHRFTGTALVTSENGTTDNERYQAEFQSDRKLNEMSWIFGAFRYDADKFGAYDPQMTATAGYGRYLMRSENHELKGEIGAGYRYLEERETGVSTDEAIMRFVLDDAWTISDNMKWANRLLIETGSENTFTQFNTGFNIAMTDKMAVKLGYEVRNNTKVPPGDSEKTDTTATVNLVYNFK
jgi:putative salt-induced outer membrane protein